LVYVKSQSSGDKIHSGATPTVSVQGEDEILNQLKNLVLTRKELSEIIESVVPDIEEHLYEYTPYDEDADIEKKKLYGKPIGHLRDYITHKPNQYPDGGTDIGFTSKAAPIARWTNWGTYRQKPQFWFEKSFDTLDFDAIFKKEGETAKRIIAEKGLFK